MFYKIPCGLALWPRGGIGRLRFLPKAGDAKAARAAQVGRRRRAIPTLR